MHTFHITTQNQSWCCLSCSAACQWHAFLLSQSREVSYYGSSVTGALHRPRCSLGCKSCPLLRVKWLRGSTDFKYAPAWKWRRWREFHYSAIFLSSLPSLSLSVLFAVTTQRERYRNFHGRKKLKDFRNLVQLVFNLQRGCILGMKFENGKITSKESNCTLIYCFKMVSKI